MITSGQNFYEILEIDESASLQEIERAYVAAKETYSPTSSALYSMFSKEEAHELHKLIEQAYNTLSNHDARQKYDALVLKHGQDNLSDSETMNLESFVQSVSDAVPQQVSIQNGVIDSKYEKNTPIEEQISSLTDCSGAFLQKVRKYKNVSLEEISQFSKVSKTNILAVEEEDFENLPAKVFIRGFVIQICKLLGIDSAAFAKEYLKSLDEFRK